MTLENVNTKTQILTHDKDDLAIAKWLRRRGTFQPLIVFNDCLQCGAEYEYNENAKHNYKYCVPCENTIALFRELGND